MALSDYEKQVLEQMEKQLRAEDPGLGSAFDASKEDFTPPATDERQHFYSSPRLWAAVFISLLLGISLLLAGVSVFHSHNIVGIILAVIGFSLMLFGVTAPFNKKIASRFNAVDNNKSSRKPEDSRSFMEKQEDRWQRRRDR